MRHLELSRGGRLPALGLGTWKSAPGEVGAAIREAIRIGYRHIDCAAIYSNEAEIGAALTECIREGLVRREQLWVTSKLWNDRHRADDVLPALEESLRKLQLDYLDLYLMHWPVAHRPGIVVPESGRDLLEPAELPISVTWSAMERAVDAGLCRHIGVSNFSWRKLEELLPLARFAPEVNQVELHPYLQQSELLASCRDNGVVLTAYSPLGSLDRPEGMREANEPKLLEDPVIGEIASNTGATPAQVLLAWALDRGTSVIPKSVHPSRLRENFEATRLELSDQQLDAIAELDRHRRYVDGTFWVYEDGPYDLANLWDE